MIAAHESLTKREVKVESYWNQIVWQKSKKNLSQSCQVAPEGVKWECVRESIHFMFYFLLILLKWIKQKQKWDRCVLFACPLRDPSPLQKILNRPPADRDYLIYES